MKDLVILFLAACSMLLISGCGDLKEGFEEGFNKEYDKAFIESWRSGFVNSCVGGDNRKSTICNCVADKSIKDLSVEQLNDLKVIQGKILPRCLTP